MTWEHPSYSFGNPNAQPPTPTRTPTSSIFPSPVFQTPLQNSYSVHSGGWTPKFVEEYPQYSSTAGGASGQHHPFTEPASRPSTAASINTNAPISEHLAQQLASHVHHTAQASLPLPPVEPSRQLCSSPGLVTGGSTVGQGSQATPQHPPRRIQTVFSQQTATPPQSNTTQGKNSTPMQGDDGNLNMFSTPGQQTMLDFSNMADPFAISASAPQTAPAYSQSNAFWDADTSMNGMTMGYPAPAPTFYNPHPQRSDSLDWNRNNPAFQQVAMSQFSPVPPGHNGHFQRVRTLASNHLMPLDPQSHQSFGFTSSMPDDPFASAGPTGAVDPGLIFAYPHELNVPRSLRQPATMSPTHLMNQQSFPNPIRNGLRSHGDLSRSQSTTELSSHVAPSKSFMSPAKAMHPGLKRSMSEARIRRPLSQGQTGNVIHNNQIPARGRMSPVKQLNRTNLAPIPETLPSSKVIFGIDSNGRAFTNNDHAGPHTAKGGPTLSDESSYTSSSSDEDFIDITSSRQPSFSIPYATVQTPNLKKRPSTEDHSLSRSNSTLIHRSTSSLSLNELTGSSAPSTIAEEGDSPGDAKTELRRVLSNRSIARPRARSIRQNQPVLQKAFTGASTMSPSAASPGGLDNQFWGSALVARHSDKGAALRCVCGYNHGQGFMLQCESCDYWLHGNCVGIPQHAVPPVYICHVCANTPNTRGGRMRDSRMGLQQAFEFSGSPLARRGFKGTNEV